MWAMRSLITDNWIHHWQKFLLFVVILNRSVFFWLKESLHWCPSDRQFSCKLWLNWLSAKCEEYIKDKNVCNDQIQYLHYCPNLVHETLVDLFLLEKVSTTSCFHLHTSWTRYSSCLPLIYMSVTRLNFSACRFFFSIHIQDWKTATSLGSYVSLNSSYGFRFIIKLTICLPCLHGSLFITRKDLQFVFVFVVSSSRPLRVFCWQPPPASFRPSYPWCLNTTGAMLIKSTSNQAFYKNIKRRWKNKNSKNAKQWTFRGNFVQHEYQYLFYVTTTMCAVSPM